MSLPKFIPLQSVPLGEQGQDGKLYVDINWYLFLYSLWLEVLGTGSSVQVPVSQGDLIDMVDLDAAGADVPQAYREISNLAALFETLPEPAPAAQPAQTVPVGASPFTWTAPFSGTLCVTGTTSGGGFTDEKGSGGTVGFASGVDFTPNVTTSLTLSQNYGSAADLWVAFDGGEQGADSYSLSGKVLTFSSAIPAGVSKVYVKGFAPVVTSVSAISIIRQGVVVPTGLTLGLIPVSRLDQIEITYSSAPTVTFLPA